jgi:hypothetical protein
MSEEDERMMEDLFLMPGMEAFRRDS